MGGETDLIAIGRTGTIGGVCSQIIGGTRLKTGDIAHKATQTSAIGGVVVVDRRLHGGTPADSFCGDGEATIGTYVASRRRCGGAYIVDLPCAHGGESVQGGDHHLLAIAHADAVAGVRTDIVGGVRREASERGIE